MAKEQTDIRAADGTAKAGLFRPTRRPAAGAQSGVILYMDAFGPRPALDGMAERLTGHGHVVLVPDLFYRAGSYGPFDAKTAFSNPDVRAKLMGLIQGTTQEMTARDSAAFLEALAAAGVTGKVGVVGYCMGGGARAHCCGGLSGPHRGGGELSRRQPRERCQGQPASARRNDQGARLCRQRRRRQQFSAGAIGSAR